MTLDTCAILGVAGVFAISRRWQEQLLEELPDSSPAGCARNGGCGMSGLPFILRHFSTRRKVTPRNRKWGRR
jgi:hypothetical protein